MPLTSPRFRNNTRLQAAANNSPVMKWGEKGEAVAIVQQALLDLGYAMPVTTKKTGHPDGIYGNETAITVSKFQQKYSLSADGIVGRNTLGKLDELFAGGGPGPTPPTSGLPYIVPGIKTVLAQPSPMGCWATVYTMMKSWKDQMSYPIRDCVGAVGTKWRDYYDASFGANPQGLPPSEFGPFLNDAHMTHEPMMNLTIEGWVDRLRMYGLLWIGASVTVNPNTGLHSRILEGMIGDGSPDGTTMKIIDPDGGKQYDEREHTAENRPAMSMLSSPTQFRRRNRPVSNPQPCPPARRGGLIDDDGAATWSRRDGMRLAEPVSRSAESALGLLPAAHRREHVADHRDGGGADEHHENSREDE